jgi:hypothetical protein
MTEWIKTHQFLQIFGFCLFVGMLAAGYYHKLTFVQLGLEDFGTRWLGLIVAR